MNDAVAPRRGWRAALDSYQHREVRVMLFLGFFSGLPFPLVLTTLALRLKQAGIDKSTIGYFSWVGLAYSLKYFWSPVVDRLGLPLLSRLGRRRGWMLPAQLGVALGLLLMALHDPAHGAEHMALLAVFTAFCAATQDIAVDAYRIECTGPQLQAATTASYQIGYQLALITAGAGVLILADARGWSLAYGAMAALMLTGVVTTLLIGEAAAAPRVQESADAARLAATTARLSPLPLLLVSALLLAWWALVPSSGKVEPVVKTLLLVLGLSLTLLRTLPALRPGWNWLVAAVVFPFLDFYERNGWKTASFVLLLIATYRLNYTTMGVMAGPFYLDKGFSLTEIASISKLYGVLMTMAGGMAAGLLVSALGFGRTLFLGLLLLSAANLFYAWMATFQPDLLWLTAAISLDNLANGVAGTAFIAYMSSLTQRRYTATQYALFGTLWSLPAKTLGGFSGRIVEAVDYPAFFAYTALLGLPALLLTLLLVRAERRASPP